mmetsp:Transcript_19943/g.47573  ORF Transcript_19943/g.47573 Transcript_19943/m.47573 type:complete len:206 (+) Transcript_19943:58-675(+)
MEIQHAQSAKTFTWRSWLFSRREPKEPGSFFKGWKGVAVTVSSIFAGFFPGFDAAPAILGTRNNVFKHFDGLPLGRTGILLISLVEKDLALRQLIDCTSRFGGNLVKHLATNKSTLHITLSWGNEPNFSVGNARIDHSWCGSAIPAAGSWFFRCLTSRHFILFNVHSDAAGFRSRARNLRGSAGLPHHATAHSRSLFDECNNIGT